VGGKFAGILAFLLLVLSASDVFAEHEVQYRYTVLGYVKDARGKPRARVSVELVREKTGFSYLGESDAEGLYVIVARLGDESLGERLALQAGAQRTGVIVRFDPRNHIQERGTRVDFLGSRSVERAGWFLVTLKRFVAR
jgi:hypothetical protein